MRSFKLMVAFLPVALLVATGATAAEPPRVLVTDKRGDSLLPDGRFDILSATLTASSRTLTAKVTLDGPPPSDGSLRVLFLVRATSPACRGGIFRWDYIPPFIAAGTPAFSVNRTPGGLDIENCGSTTHDHASVPVVRGNTITWTARRLVIEPSGLLPGTVFDQPRVMALPTALLHFLSPPAVAPERRRLREYEPPVDVATSQARYVVP